jgi:tripartite ATP-independent transporter DctM subunit
MTIIDLPMNIVYGVCLFGFVAMTVRSVLVMRRHMQRGYSVLERPESTMATADMLKILFLLLMAGGVPVAIAMAGASLVYILWSGDLPGFAVVHRMIGGIDSFPLLAVPFFILAGNLMNNAGITNRIYNFALALVGWLKGGLGHVNVVGSVIFAGMSGTAIADAAGLGTIEIKAMKDHGYDTEFAVGVTAASATLGPIIPPSLPFVIYAMMANVSVGALFLAGILPGVLMALLMMATVAYFAHKNGWGGDIKFEWPRVRKALIETAVVIAWPLALYHAVKAGAPAQVTWHRRWWRCSWPTRSSTSRPCCPS